MNINAKLQIVFKSSLVPNCALQKQKSTVIYSLTFCFVIIVHAMISKNSISQNAFHNIYFLFDENINKNE